MMCSPDQQPGFFTPRFINHVMEVTGQWHDLTTANRYDPGYQLTIARMGLRAALILSSQDSDEPIPVFERFIPRGNDLFERVLWEVRGLRDPNARAEMRALLRNFGTLPSGSWQKVPDILDKFLLNLL